MRNYIDVVLVRDNAGWYADVPGHTRDENELVGDTAEALDVILNNRKGRWRFKIYVGTKKSPEDFLMHLTLIKHDQFGGTYKIVSRKGSKNGMLGFNVWLCNVTHDALGGHPKDFYITSIVPA